MSGLQSPELLTDLYRDLRDRRLLPLVIVLVVGIAIVPMALSSSAKTPAPAPGPPAAAVADKSKAPATEVVLADPGVRDFHRRLKDDFPKDPFVQEFTAPITPVAAGGDSSSPGAATGSASSGAGSALGSTAPAQSPPPAGTGGSASQPKTESKYYSYRVKVRSGQLGQELKVRESVGSLTQLPSNAVPALAFLGVTTGNSFQPKAAVFLVSSAVSSVDGKGTCTFAGTSCQLLSLKPGEHEDLVWTDGLIYRIELVKFNLIVRDNPPSVSGQGNSTGGGNSSAGRGEPGSGRSSRNASFHFSF